MLKRNARVFLDVLLPSSKEPARLICELFTQTVPLTSHHFRSLFSMGLYTQCDFHRCIEDFMIQLGDHLNVTNMPCLTSLEKEGLKIKPKQYHLIMANDQEENPTNQFFILTTDAPHLLNTHVVFGVVISGFDTVHAIERTKVDEQDRPILPILIVHSGELIKQPKSFLPPSSNLKQEPSSLNLEKGEVKRSLMDESHSSPLTKEEKKRASRSPLRSHRSTSYPTRTLTHRTNPATFSSSSSSSNSVTADIYASLFGSTSSSTSSTSSLSHFREKKRKLMVLGDRYDLQGRKIKGRGVSKYKPL